jgi:2-polyprenyl-6-methoxyphenol hydroxylase-like FAD-dependent oxidoreductase
VFENPATGRHAPVLIVGAGPAGLTTAITLAHYGVESVLAERRPVLSGLPRAASVSTRTMELLRSWGLEQEIRAGGVEVEWRQWVGPTLAAAGEARPMSFPTGEQSTVLSPTAPASVPQDHLEPVLLSHLRSLGATRVAFGTEVVGVESRPEGARVVLREAGTGKPRVIHPRFLIAADGARSTVRAALGIPMYGPGRLSAAVATLFRAPLWGLLGSRRYAIYSITHPEAAGVFVPAGRGDRWTYGLVRESGPVSLADYSQDRVTRLIRLGAGLPDLQPRIERIGAFTFTAQLADRFREGDTFLVGDAAHRMTPRGGTGMNTAIHGAYDLGWKLAWVLRGWAAPPLLDTYETEHRPLAAHNVARSADPDGGARGVEQELHADLAGRIAHLWLPSRPGRVSTLDLLGPGLTLFTGPASAPWDTAAAALAVPPPLAVRNLDAITARGMGIRAGGALLALPDGAPAVLWPPGTNAAPALQTAIRSILAGTRSSQRRTDPIGQLSRCRLSRKGRSPTSTSGARNRQPA